MDLEQQPIDKKETDQATEEEDEVNLIRPGEDLDVSETKHPDLLKSPPLPRPHCGLPLLPASPRKSRAYSSSSPLSLSSPHRSDASAGWLQLPSKTNPEEAEGKKDGGLSELLGIVKEEEATNGAGGGEGGRSIAASQPVLDQLASPTYPRVLDSPTPQQIALKKEG